MHISIDICVGRPGGRQTAVEVQPDVCADVHIYTNIIYIYIYINVYIHIKSEPEPLEKEINEILGSKREDRLSDPFFELVQNTT